MNRRVLCGAVATTASWVGFAASQTPAAKPTGSSADGPVYVMKTAGQPERRVVVVKSEKLPDGTFLTDVKDLASGVVYTLSNPAVLGIPTTETLKPPTAKPAVATVPTTTGYVPPAAVPPVNTPRPLFGAFPNQPQAVAAKPMVRGEKLVPVESVQGPFGSLPKARDRKDDPLLAGVSTSPAAMTARTPFPTGTTLPASQSPSLLDKLTHTEEREPAKPRVVSTSPVTPPQPLPLMPATGAVVVLPPPNPLPDGPVMLPKPTESAKPPAEKPAVPASEPRAVLEKPASVPIPPFDTPAEPVPPAVAALPTPAPALVALPAPVVAAVPMAVLPASAPVALPANLPALSIPTAPSPIAVVDGQPQPEPALAAKSELPGDVKGMLDALGGHKRPSFRMENATALAESSYSKHPDVLAALLKAAKNDATGVVRGHCISQLSALGYSDPGYLQSLDGWTTDVEPAVRRAAANAKAKLAGR